MSFATTIKRLRRNKDMTQEQLAEVLSVSPQAVSRWETDSAMPDISLIAPLCHFFGITADELLGIESQNTELRISEFKKEIDFLYSQRRTDEMIALGHAMLKKYPGNYRVQRLLSFALANQENPSQADLDEVIRLTEDNMSKCNDESLHYSDLLMLTRCYSRKGDKENARKYSLKLPNSFAMTAPYQLARFGLVTDNEHIAFFENRISELSGILTDFIYYLADATDANYGSGGFGLSNYERISILESALSLLHTVYGDRVLNKSYEAYNCSRAIGCLYLLEDKKEDAVKWFGRAADYAIEYSNYDEAKDKYISPLVSSVQPKRPFLGSLAEDFLIRISRQDRYDVVRNEPEFKTILCKLERSVRN